MQERRKYLLQKEGSCREANEGIQIGLDHVALGHEIMDVGLGIDPDPVDGLSQLAKSVGLCRPLVVFGQRDRFPRAAKRCGHVRQIAPKIAHPFIAIGSRLAYIRVLFIGITRIFSRG